MYVTPGELRRALKLDTQNAMQEAELEPIIRSTSRYIDNHTGRWFYVLNGTRYYDSRKELWLPDDVISVTTLKWDQDGDDTYETTLTEGTDFRGWPYNMAHFRRLDVIGTGQLGSWPNQAKALELEGTFGWSEETVATGLTGTVGSTTGTDLTLSAAPGTLIELGHTILIGSEQMYVEDADGDSLTVKRAVNGTTATTHTTAAISVYEYAGGAIRNEIIACATRWYREFATGFSGAISSMNEQGYSTFRTIWPAIVDGLATYRHPALAVA